MKTLLKEYNATKRHTESWLKKIEGQLLVNQELRNDIRLKKGQYLLMNSEKIREEELELLDKQETVQQMLSDVNYIISWLRRGGQPNRKRGIERQGVYKREIAFDPYWIQLRKDGLDNIDTIEQLFVDVDTESELIKESLVKEVTKNLSDKQKQIITMKADGITHNEIAETLDIPKGTVDVTIKRIKEKIKAEGWFML